jgi:hypothetical protein
MRIPIIAAKRIADEYGQNQVVLVTFDKSDGTTHVVTYGKSVEECAQAAQGGNFVKRALGWPESLCNAKSARARRGDALAALARDIEERERALNDSIAKGHLSKEHGEGAAQARAIEALRAHLSHGATA